MNTAHFSPLATQTVLRRVSSPRRSQLRINLEVAGLLLMYGSSCAISSFGLYGIYLVIGSFF